MKILAFLLLGGLLSFTDGASSDTPDLTLRQLNQRVFDATDGARSEISALAQASDGTLWVGGRTGLSRFDGVRFIPYPSPGEEPLHSTNISTLFVASDGGLWIGFRPGGVSLLKDGRVSRFSIGDGLPNGTVGQFAEDRDGSIWAAARVALARFNGGRWETIDDDLGTPYGVLVDRAGTLWVATIKGLYARVAGEGHFSQLDGKSYFSPGGLALAPAADGKFWAAAQGEILGIDGSTNPARAGAFKAPGVLGGPLLVDDEGNLWSSDTQTKGLLRMSSHELRNADPRAASLRAETFTRADGLSVGPVSALLQDRERNVWVATHTALHRFSRSNVVRAVMPTCMQYGVTAAAFAAGEVGSLWIACHDRSAGYVNEIRDGKVVKHLNTTALTAAYRDEEGTVWFGGPMTLGRLERGQVVTTPLPAEFEDRPVQAIVRDRSGAMWVSIGRKGTFRLRDGTWSENGNVAGLPREPAYVQVVDDSGSLWFGYTDSRVARVNDNAMELFDASRGLEVGNVLSILAQGSEIWVGGELGFARFDGKRFVSIAAVSDRPFRGISGTVGGRNGDLWLNGTDGITRISRNEIERVIRNSTYRVAAETFDYLDGVPGSAVQLRPQPSAIQTSDGRIWFSTTGGIVSIDATQLLRNPLPPPVTIWSITSGAQRYSSLATALRLPEHTRDLDIDYSAGSLTVPERVRFRYRLEGLDSDWHDVGTRREAHYTNLGPGQYTFRVTASNNDGVWNETGAAIAFSIAPAFYQTRWFYALCALACAGLITALYRVRMRQVAAQVRGRLEARLAERERIARDLHDTLLQGIQGLIWRFQAATDRIPESEPARALMEQSLDRADRLLEESRDKVKDLRPAASSVTDLAQALAAEGEQFAQLHCAKFKVSVQGARRVLHPIVREEGFMIGREALSNAFRHAGAADIEAEVTYDDSALHVRIRDDGQGIGAAVLDAGGTPGHFGLIGMRERAKKLGARLEVWSKPGAGTEVDLRVPAEVAYRRAQVAPRAIRWFTPWGSSTQEH